MNESAIFNISLDGIETHGQQWGALKQANPGLTSILDRLERPVGTALVFSHDDPDGITSGLMFKRTLQKKGWKVCARFPEGFALQPEQLKKAREENPDAKVLFLLDKGTLDSYQDYAKDLEVVIIDHHPTPKAPANCTIFNPSIPNYTWCSTSILAHGIACLAGTRDRFDDFLALIGMKGDWAIEPVRGLLSPFVKPFLKEFGFAFKNLLVPVQERPTQFDAEQRDVTCLLSRIAEFVHGTGGGGFSYFYHDRHPSLAKLDHAACIAEGLETLADKVDALNGLASLDAFTVLLPEPQQGLLKRIFSFFLEDWERANRLLDSSVKTLQLRETAIYLFVGGKVPLLPMIGSIKLFEMKNAARDEQGQIIMVSSVSPEYTHVSVRGTGDKVHSGKICGYLQDFLRETYPDFKHLISGGGHPKAAECTIRTAAVPFVKVLGYVLANLNEMATFAAQDSLTPVQRERAVRLGMDYLPA